MKRFIAFVLVFICLFSFTGCSIVSDFAVSVLGSGKVKDAESSPHFAFSCGTVFEDSQETVFTAEQICQTDSQYSVYRNNLHFSSLNENEQKIYLAFEYALENCYTNIFVDTLLVSDTDTLEKVLMFFALDTPLLEQNLRYKIGDFTMGYPVEIVGSLTAEAKLTGYYITINNFEKSLWDKKLPAISKAKEIVSSLPTDISEIEKAERLFLHLSKNTEYVDYDEEGENEWTVYPYLYDALITGSSHCDGFSNALSLLYNIAGIESAEKHYSPKSDSEDDIGHTWTVFKIDDKWYNADAAAQILPKKDCSLSSGISFAFSDEISLYKEDYDEVTPECVSYNAILDATISDYTSNNFVTAVYNAYNAKNPDWALIKITYSISESSLENWMEKAANKVGKNIYWYDFPLHDDSTLVLIFDKGLF